VEIGLSRPASPEMSGARIQVNRDADAGVAAASTVEGH
jgi:hypothetical protein